MPSSHDTPGGGPQERAGPPSVRAERARVDADPVGARHLDAAAVRVLAHPLRSRLLTALRISGPATATDLARRLGTNTGATSYHLRQLAEVGLVEDTGAGEGRRREWRAADRYHSFVTADFDDDPDARAASQWLEHHYVRDFAERIGAWIDAQGTWPEPWRRVLGRSDDMVTVTPEQADALGSELWAVIQRYRDAGAGDPGAVRILAATQLHPIDPEQPPADPEQQIGDRQQRPAAPEQDR